MTWIDAHIFKKNRNNSMPFSQLLDKNQLLWDATMHLKPRIKQDIEECKIAELIGTTVCFTNYTVVFHIGVNTCQEQWRSLTLAITPHHSVSPTGY